MVRATNLLNARGRVRMDATCILKHVARKECGMKKWMKWLLLAIVGLLLITGIVMAYLTHGLLWSVDSWVYGQVFRSMPRPPGAGHELTDLTPYHLSGSNSYFVDISYTETVDFFLTALPQSGWTLTTKEETSETDMLFLNRQRYWLCVKVWENKHISKTSVDMAISKEQRHVFGHCFR